MAIVIRWRVYMRRIVIHLRHISGAKNTVEDWMSRHIMHFWYHEYYLGFYDSDRDILFLIMMCPEGSSEALDVSTSLAVFSKLLK